MTEQEQFSLFMRGLKAEIHRDGVSKDQLRLRIQPEAQEFDDSTIYFMSNESNLVRGDLARSRTSRSHTPIYRAKNEGKPNASRRGTFRRSPAVIAKER